MFQQVEKGSWKPAVVTQVHNNRAYTIQIPEGVWYRRNRHHLTKTNEYFPEIPRFDFQTSAEETINNESRDFIPLNPESLQASQLPALQPFPVPAKSKPPVNSGTDQPVYTTRYGRQVKHRQIMDV
ncbi:hypothetical protein DPMN_170030 [Dreissena polymorpha]|uniref:Uncharacterized protein n=1 Tax=Dreissena polymorpha TaxID=45954 RepID=A0A9D4ICU1_DREPO|nr:hypothetical protein DPMN_170030 [Dreissena polymorpha]